MKYNVEYKSIFVYTVEADSLDEAIEKADELKDWDDDMNFYKELSYVECQVGEDEWKEYYFG